MTLLELWNLQKSRNRNSKIISVLFCFVIPKKSISLVLYCRCDDWESSPWRALPGPFDLIFLMKNLQSLKNKITLRFLSNFPTNLQQKVWICIINIDCIIFQVKASYKYQAEDVDELAFDVGEIVNVVEYDDPEEQVSREAISSNSNSILCRNSTTHLYKHFWKSQLLKKYNHLIMWYHRSRHGSWFW